MEKSIEPPIEEVNGSTATSLNFDKLKMPEAAAHKRINSAALFVQKSCDYTLQSPSKTPRVKAKDDILIWKK